jgi:hypothetical protein
MTSPFPLPAPALQDAKHVGWDFLDSPPDPKHTILLAIILHSEFQGITTFGSQVHFILEAPKDSPSRLVTHQDIAHTFSCNPGSIAFQIQRMSGVVHPVGRPRLLTPGAYEMIVD